MTTANYVCIIAVLLGWIYWNRWGNNPNDDGFRGGIGLSIIGGGIVWLWLDMFSSIS